MQGNLFYFVFSSESSLYQEANIIVLILQTQKQSLARVI